MDQSGQNDFGEKLDIIEGNRLANSKTGWLPPPAFMENL